MRRFPLGLLCLALAVTGCRAASEPAPAEAVDAGPACLATFSGDFTDESDLEQSCASLTHPTDGGSDWYLQVQVPSAVLQTQTMFSADLGSAPEAGDFEPESVSWWNALALTGGCEFVTGSDGAPGGNFQLQLDSLTPEELHGHLQVQLFVEATPGTECGPSNEESLDVKF